jgi:hypothetical protein
MDLDLYGKKVFSAFSNDIGNEIEYKLAKEGAIGMIC